MSRRPDLDLANRIDAGVVDLGAYEHTCAGDADDDGLTNVDDLLVVLAQWETAGPEGDLDDSGLVGVGDLLVTLGDWDCGVPPTEKVPPPAEYFDCIERYEGYPDRQAACVEALARTAGE